MKLKSKVKIMSTLIICCCVAIFVFIIGMIYFVRANNADPRLMEMITPVIGALFVSALWTAKLIQSQSQEKIEKRANIANIEYVHGGQIPIFNNLAKKPFSLSGLQLWNTYINQWNHHFLNKRPASSIENMYNSDPVHFRFFEYFFLKQLSEKFSLGWNHNSQLLSNAPWGNSGSSNSGVPISKYDRVFLKKLLNFEQLPNSFIQSDNDQYFQLAVPKGSQVKIDRSELGLTVYISHSRFKMSLGIEMGKSMFTASGLRDTISYPFFEKLLQKFQGYGIAANTSEIRMRNFTMSMNFKQGALNQFNADADLDRLFANNIWNHFAKSLSWDNQKDWYQEAVFN